MKAMRRFRSAWLVVGLSCLSLLLPGPEAKADLVGLWRFDSDVSPQPDSSGNGHDAMPSGEVAWVNDPDRGGVYEFNGGNGAGPDYLEVEDTDLLSIEGDLTIAAWGKFNQFDDWNGIVSKTGLPEENNHNRPAPYDVYLLHQGRGTQQLFIGDGAGGIQAYAAEESLELEEWTHIAMTYSEDGDIVHYLNGEVVGEGFVTSIPLDLDQNLYIGGRADWVTNISDGALDDVAIFNEVLDEAAILAIMGGDFSAYGVGGGGDPGDFDADGDLDAADIDALTAEVLGGMNPAAFDLNDDMLVNSADRDVWVEQLRNTYFGDSNLDGEFNSADFVQVFSRGEYEDATNNNSTWEDGDWDGDGDFSSSDFVKAFTGGGYETGPRAATAAVPEPQAITLVLWAAAAAMRFRRRR